MPTQRTYYNRFTPKERWDSILFIPARELQTAEMIEIQAMFDQKLKQLGDVFFTDGVPLNGAGIITPETYPGTLTIEAGYVYVQGVVVYTDRTEVIGSFTGENIEWIYVNLIESFETDEYRDPAFGHPNYKQFGADRRILSVQFTNEDNKTIDSFRFDWIRDGQVFFQRALHSADKINVSLEERTYEELGDFLVEGGNITVKDSENDDTGIFADTYEVILEPYNAYLKGKRYVTLNPQVFTIEKPLETEDIQAFFQVAYHIDSSPRKFLLDKSYIKKINTVIYPVFEVRNMLRATSGTEDLFDVTDIIQVVSVEQNGYVFTENVDYRITVTGIDWSLGSPGIEPNPGTSYEVELIYYRTANAPDGDDTYGALPYDEPEPGRRFTIEYPNSADGVYEKAYVYIEDDQYYTGLPDALINAEYTIYQFKNDAIVIDKLTGFAAVRSSNYDDVLPLNPRIFSEDFLMWIIRPEPGNYYDATNYDKEDERTFRITERGVRTMRNQLVLAQENLTFVQLDTDAANMPVPGVLEGLYTDLLNNADRSNITYSGNGIDPVSKSSQLLDVHPQTFDASFDDGSVTQRIIINQDAKDVGTASVGLHAGKAYTLPFSHVEFISQPLATTAIDMQPYQISEPQPVIEIDPYNDVYLDEQLVTIDTTPRTRGTSAKTGKTEGIEKREQRTKDPAQIDLNKAKVEQRTVNRIGFPPVKRGHVQGEKVANKPAVIRVLDVATETSFAQTLRQKQITITGSGWILAALPDGVDYVFYATMSGVSVNNFDNLITLNGSDISGTFWIPAGVPAGNSTLKVWVVRSDQLGTPLAEAETNYFADGFVITSTQTIITDGGNLELDDDGRDRKNPRWSTDSDEGIHDNGDGSKIAKTLRAIRSQPTPSKTTTDDFLNKDGLAQTILTDEDIFISKIDLYFSAKDSNSNRVVELLIATIDNGYPTQNYIATTYLKSSDINTGVDSSGNPVATSFEFSHPVYLQGSTEYAIVLRSPNSNSFRLYVAVQGETDIITNKPVITQPYDGVLFKSPNGTTYVADTDADLTFKVYRASFEETAELVMASQTISDAWMLINARIQEYGSSRCRIYYKVIRTTDPSIDLETWFEYRHGSKHKLVSEKEVQAIQVKFVMNSNVDEIQSTDDTIVYSDKLSPVLGKQIGTLYWKYAESSFYCTPVLDMGLFNGATLIIETIPRDQTFTVVFACADANQTTWYRYTSAEVPPIITLIDDSEGIQRYKYKYEFDFTRWAGTPTETPFTIYPNLAKYMMLGIEIGGDNADGSDTPHIMNLRISSYEVI